MIAMRRLALAVAPMLAWSAVVAAPLDAQPRAVRTLAGCYRVTADSADRHGAYPGFAPLPPLVRLDTVPERSRSGKPTFRASPDVTTYHELAFTPTWQVVGRDSLVVNWFDGFVGPTLVLRRDGARWRGRVSYRYHEDTGAGPDVPVVAVRVACDRSRPRR